jgi:hypothetical protein
MEFIRYNSLREFADLVIDAPSDYYRSAGVDLFPAGNGLPVETPEISPARIFIKIDFLFASIEFLKSLKKPFHLLTGAGDIPGCPDPQVADLLKNSRLFLGQVQISKFTFRGCFLYLLGSKSEDDQGDNLKICPFSPLPLQKRARSTFMSPILVKQIPIVGQTLPHSWR